MGHFQDALEDNIGVYRPSNSTFYIRAHGGLLLRSARFGTKGDLPVVGRFEDSPSTTSGCTGRRTRRSTSGPTTGPC